MRFSSPEKFNALIEENKPGLPAKNPVQLLSFLLGPFTQLTNRLTALLRPREEDLKDRAFFEKSTILTMYTIAGAISALANTDSISQISAGYTVDGTVSLGIRGVAQVTISVKDHHFTTQRFRRSIPEPLWNLPLLIWPTACLQDRFQPSMRCARGIFTCAV